MYDFLCFPKKLNIFREYIFVKCEFSKPRANGREKIDVEFYINLLYARVLLDETHFNSVLLVSVSFKISTRNHRDRVEVREFGSWTFVVGKSTFDVKLIILNVCRTFFRVIKLICQQFFVCWS